ncbi:reverse transcriptase family protein [Gordonia sp. CPCC 205333]|uniref:reverse transcriptase family protein n=1 Tax=Gordonia sp. CPCC 205333 TaxID=3140790 RepID=UPI003AF332D9
MVAAVERMVGSQRDSAWDHTVWIRPELSGALVEAIEPSDAEEVARQILEKFAVPPVRLRSALSTLIAGMPPRPRIVEFDEIRSGAPEFGLPPINDVDALAAWLNITIDELMWFADRGDWLRKSVPRLQHYRVRRIPKRHGGFRVIEAPKERLATLQRRVLAGILNLVPAHPAAHGFVKGRSPESFARPHSLHDNVIRIDLKHCFEHVTIGRVQTVFTAIGYSPAVSRYLAAICTTSTTPGELPIDDVFHAGLLRNRHVPQGAPTSPALVNLALRRLDFRVAGYAKANQMNYTRYGDDLALSGDMTMGRALWVVSQVIADEGFTIHPDKVRVMGDHQRQQLTGLVVNERPRSRRSEYDALKALLHNATRTGAAAQNHSERGDFRAYVYGRIGWVATGSDIRRQKLLALAAQVDWDN